MCAGTLSAQEYVDFGSRQYVPFGPIQNTPDWDWFAPVTDHLMDQAQKQSDGYFFSYERLHWWLSKSDRAQVGADVPQSVNAFYSHSVQSIYDDAELSQRTLFVAPGGFVDFGNSVTSSNPVTVNGWGNRWEVGYVEDRWGLMVSVLDRMKLHGSTWYGVDDKRRFQLAAAQGLDGVDGEFTGQLVVIGTDPTFRAPIAAVPSIQALLAIDGLLTVHMIFEDPFNSLLGFIDNDGDGVSDDINGDGIIDDNDRVRFGVTYDEMHITNQTYLSGVELMSIRRKLPTYHGAFVEVFLGARYVEFDDRYDAVAYGGILADSAWSQRALNRIVGPAFGFHWQKRHGRWNFGIQGRGMMGGNFVRIRQQGVIADHLTATGVFQPGAPAVAPTSFFHVLNDEKFSPVGELRAEASLLVTKSIALKVGWNGTVIGGLSRASNTIRYRLPNMGIVDHNDEAFVQGVNFGFEICR
jgi:hypothetical protein